MNDIINIIEGLAFGALGGLSANFFFNHKGASKMEYHTEQIHLEAADIAGVAEVAAQTGQGIEDAYRAVIKAGVAALVTTNVTNVTAPAAAPDANVTNVNVTNVQAAQPAPVDPVAALQDAAIAQAQAALDAAIAAKAATQPAATV